MSETEIIEVAKNYSICVEPGVYDPLRFECEEDLIGFARAILAAQSERQPEAYRVTMKRWQQLYGKEYFEVRPLDGMQKEMYDTVIPLYSAAPQGEGK